MANRVMVTGGLGFIGSAFVRHQADQGADVFNVDAYTYAADERRLDCSSHRRISTKRLDVSSDELIPFVLQVRPDVIVHFASETHVTRSETDTATFFQSNVVGTYRVMEAAEKSDVDLVVHISTDEVYGPCSGHPFKESDKRPDEGLATSSYARSKAIADAVAQEFSERAPVIVVRPTNCFGPWQHPEKAIPRWCTRALLGEEIPVWGTGEQIRDWMYLDDAVWGIETVIAHGHAGEIYNLGPGGHPRTNLDIAQTIARAAGRSEDAVYLSEYDRPQHDQRYAIDASKIRALGWEPQADLDSSLEATVDWYRNHADWWGGLVPQAEKLYSDLRSQEAR